MSTAGIISGAPPISLVAPVELGFLQEKPPRGLVPIHGTTFALHLQLVLVVSESEDPPRIVRACVTGGAISRVKKGPLAGGKRARHRVCSRGCGPTACFGPGSILIPIARAGWDGRRGRAPHDLGIQSGIWVSCRGIRRSCADFIGGAERRVLDLQLPVGLLHRYEAVLQLGGAEGAGCHAVPHDGF